MDTYQLIIGIDGAFYQILDRVPSLGKPEVPLVIKSKPYETKNKVKP